MRLGASLSLGVFLFIVGLILVSGIIAWLIKVLGYTLMIVGAVSVILSVVRRAPRRRGG